MSIRENKRRQHNGFVELAKLARGQQEQNEKYWEQLKASNQLFRLLCGYIDTKELGPEINRLECDLEYLSKNSLFDENYNATEMAQRVAECRKKLDRIEDCKN
jgi:hypothetical protein